MVPPGPRRIISLPTTVWRKVQTSYHIFSIPSSSFAVIRSDLLPTLRKRFTKSRLRRTIEECCGFVSTTTFSRTIQLLSSTNSDTFPSVWSQVPLSYLRFFRHDLSSFQQEDAEIASLLFESLYVDDFAGGAYGDEDAVQVYHVSQHLMGLGGFTLQKWHSSSPYVHEVIDSDYDVTKSDRSRAETTPIQPKKTLTRSLPLCYRHLRDMLQNKNVMFNIWVSTDTVPKNICATLVHTTRRLPYARFHVVSPM